MPGKHIHLSGYLDVPEARLAAVLEALQEHIRLSRAEPGCLSFSVVQDPARPTRLLVTESFASRAAFDAHQARAGASAWARVTRGLPRRYQIRKRAP